jgi:Ribosome biogenesis protein Nop16
LKPHWDASKTPSENLSALGLVADPNSKIRESSSTNKAEGSIRASVASKNIVIELFDVPDSDGLLRSGNVKKFPLDMDEEQYIIKCMNKYGMDYMKMFRDTKINDMQYTEEKLCKLGTRFILLTPEQRRIVDVPENIQKLFK